MTDCQNIQDQITTLDTDMKMLQEIISDPNVASSVKVGALHTLNIDFATLANLQNELQLCLHPCAPIEAKIQADTSQILSLTQQIAALTAQLDSVQADLQQQQQALAQCQQLHH